MMGPANDDKIGSTVLYKSRYKMNDVKVVNCKGGQITRGIMVQNASNGQMQLVYGFCEMLKILTNLNLWD